MNRYGRMLWMEERLLDDFWHKDLLYEAGMVYEDKAFMIYECSVSAALLY